MSPEKRRKKTGRLTLHNRNPALNESNRNRTVAQHGKMEWVLGDYWFGDAMLLATKERLNG